MKITFSRFAVASVALLLSKLVSATPVSISSSYQVEGLGFYSGTLDYVANSSTNATLTLILNNLPSTSAGGAITAVALNLPTVSGVSFSALTSTAPANFSQLGSSANDNAINTSPLGGFDFGAAISSNGMAAANWQGGGNPNQGIAINGSGTFVFNFTGANLDTLSTLSFVNAVAPGNTSGPSQFIAVRFRGFTGNGSDKVGAIVPFNPPNPVPVPPSVWLMLSGLGGLGLISRKRKANA